MPPKHDQAYLSQLYAVIKQIEQPDSAIHYAQKALQVAQQLNDQEYAARLHYLMGENYDDQRIPKMALAQYQKAIQLAKATHQYDLLHRLYIHYAYISRQIGDTQSDLEYLLKANAQADSLQNEKMQLEVSFALGDYFPACH
ncbi:MAG: hypothetical protein AAGD05_17530 [Bacteroidota bacterium]